MLLASFSERSQAVCVEDHAACEGAAVWCQLGYPNPADKVRYVERQAALLEEEVNARCPSYLEDSRFTTTPSSSQGVSWCFFFFTWHTWWRHKATTCFMVFLFLYLAYLVEAQSNHAQHIVRLQKLPKAGF